MSTQETTDEEPMIQQPGLSDLRQTVANYLGKELPGRATIRQDAVAGFSLAISNVPDGMANGVLVGVNPVYGLYATMLGPFVGGIVSSTQLMMITTTAAASLATGQALGSLTGADRDNALFVMVLLIGAFQIVFGLLGFGRLTRFVSYSVMTGFLTGVSVLLILNQLPQITGYTATGSNKILQTLDLVGHLDQVNLLSVALAGLTLLLAVTLPRTRLGSFGTLVAIIVPSALVALFSLDSVNIVRDLGSIPGGFPMPVVPSFANLSLEVMTGAAAVAAIILVQGAGVSQSVPNPDGAPRSMSRDFVAQGAANIATGLFRGLPVGGSLSATALGVIYGARTRWAMLFGGLWMALIVLIFPEVVSYIAMPALGALLILAGLRGVKLSEMAAIFRIGWPSGIVSITTFLATLFLPIQAAVGLGVVLSALLYLVRSSSDISLVQLVKRPDERLEERPPSQQLPSNQTTVLDVYGNLFYAGAHTLERLLPTPENAEKPMVILRLRGQANVGATLINVLTNYAEKLKKVQGQLYLTGISEGAYKQFMKTGRLQHIENVHIYEATAIRGQSTDKAYTAAQTWLVSANGETEPDASSVNVTQ
jgi:sulfate permease, SulP family